MDRLLCSIKLPDLAGQGFIPVRHRPQGYIRGKLLSSNPGNRINPKVSLRVVVHFKRRRQFAVLRLLLAPDLLMPLTVLVKTQNEQALVGKVP